jgi:hypothetical protein
MIVSSYLEGCKIQCDTKYSMLAKEPYLIFSVCFAKEFLFFLSGLRWCERTFCFTFGVWNFDVLRLL